MGIIFAKQRPAERVIVAFPITNRSFELPPGASDHPVKSELTFKGDARVVTFWPHMHVRGKSFRFDSVTPEGTRTTALNVPKYDFNWQHRYVPSEPLRSEPRAASWNASRPSTTRRQPGKSRSKATVRWGDQSWEEMMVGFIRKKSLSTRENLRPMYSLCLLLRFGLRILAARNRFGVSVAGASSLV